MTGETILKKNVTEYRLMGLGVRQSKPAERRSTPLKLFAHIDLWKFTPDRIDFGLLALWFSKFVNPQDQFA
jgi:hypothetical protein